MAADARSIVASAAIRPPTVLHVAVLAPVAWVEAGGVDDGLEGDPYRYNVQGSGTGLYSLFDLIAWSDLRCKILYEELKYISSLLSY